MHKVFEIPELVDLIVQCLVVYTPIPLKYRPTPVLSCLTTDAYREIIAVGQTARLFRNPSLNALWRVQISLIPLLRSVGLVTREEKVWGVTTVVTFNTNRSIHDVNICALLPYSSRITELHFTSIGQVTYQDDFFVDNHAPPSSLFPALRVLTSRADRTGSLELTFVLRNVENALQRLDIARCPLPLQLFEAPFKTSSLASLSLNLLHDRGEVIVPVQLAPILQRCHRLQVLYLVLDFDISCILRSLVRLPSLTRLTLFLHEVPLPSIPTRMILPSVVHLRLFVQYAGSLQLTTHILSKCTLPTLTFLEVQFCHAQPSLTEAAHLFTAITSSNPTATLRSLTLSVKFDEHVRTGERLHSDTLRPLLVLPIRSLFLDLPWLWNLDDGLICDMARAWPNLEVLSMDTICFSTLSTSASATVSGLEALVRYCPALRHIEIPFSGTVTVPAAALDLSTVPAHARRENTRVAVLGVGCGVVTSPIETAMYLRKIFPRLKGVTPVSTTSSDIVESWRKVGAILSETVKT
ncbi:hypothetical protein BXZ70DRAFT_489004 [Cristinia sonorae]|uniref:F-box domain-containing protein n=1 Tax=Cristinia sonorae TaxID=1940300 RepID=A0A8K0XLN8_9AGAR|nr:hypothetical protein BXZ70DRAFT_489004 [Cristinia sonorae]